jgi:hypothetical protein
MVYLMTEEQKEECKLIEQIDKTENIITTLVENIYRDESYQEYLKDLEVSDTKSDAKKLSSIKQTFSNIRIFNKHSEPLFLAKDIGIIIGASNINQMIKSYTNTEKVEAYIAKDGKIDKKMFLTKHGIYRVLFTNKTKLSELFRGFIYKLIDHMMSFEQERLCTIINELTKDNPRLTEDAMKEINVNALKYQVLYEQEREQRMELETEVDYTEMYIKQLKIDKQHMIERIKYRDYEYSTEDNALALDILKHKYLKEISISLVNPKILDDLFHNPKSPYDLEDEKYILTRYKDDYRFLIKTFNVNNHINNDDIYYLHLTYLPHKSNESGKEKQKEKEATVIKVDDEPELNNAPAEPDFYPVDVDYIYDRASFSELIEELKVDNPHYNISKNKRGLSGLIFKTSIEDIKHIVKKLLVKSPA